MFSNPNAATSSGARFRRVARGALVVLGCAALGAHLAAAQRDDPSESDLRARVAAAVERLGADSFQERRAASEQLLKWGPDILPLLPEPAALDDASVREGVRGVRVALERRMARDSTRASRVSLSDTAPLAQVLDAIERQTGNAIDRGEIPAEDLRRESSVDFHDAPFWNALGNIAQRTELRIAADARGRAVRLVPRDDAANSGDAPNLAVRDPLAVDDGGPFRLTVESARLRPLFGDAARQLLRVRIGVQSEPRLRPMFLALAGKDIAARSPAGTKFAPFDPEAKFELPIAEGGTRLFFAIDFIVPAESPPAAIALAGRMTVQTAAGREAVRFPPLADASNVSRRRGGATVSIGRIAIASREPNAFDAVIPLTVAYDAGGPAFESHRQWVFHNEVHLEQADGTRVALTAPFRTSVEADGAAVLEYTFRGLAGEPADYRFVYVLPTLIVDVPVEFDFPRIPVDSPPKEEPE